MKRNTRYEKVDYEELEGKVIDWIQGGRAIKAVVSGCNRDIGITLKANQHYPETDFSFEIEEGLEFTCLNGPHSPHPTSRKYNALFTAAVNMIEAGFYSARTTERIAFGFSQYRRMTLCPGNLNCAFGS